MGSYIYPKHGAGGSILSPAFFTQVGFTSIGEGSQNVAVSGTREQLPNTACNKAIVVAKGANTGTIWVGGASVAVNRGVPLVALQSEIFEVTNLNLLYIDSTVDGEGITFAYLL